MKWAYDYKHQRGAWIDEDGFNWDTGEMMKPSEYDEEEVRDDHWEYERELLESDEEQAMERGWIQNENYNSTYGLDDNLEYDDHDPDDYDDDNGYEDQVDDYNDRYDDPDDDYYNDDYDYDM